MRAKTTTDRVRYDVQRGTAPERGYDHRWKLLSRAHRRREPLCRHCANAGRVRLGELVDHIRPLKAGGTNDEANLQTLCRACHKVKTDAETRA